MSHSTARVRIGTSGWSYAHWRGPFYPPELPSDRWLTFYSGQLPTVEINSSYYRLPKAAVLRRWREEVPQDFRFAVKASRFITHMKRLRDATRSVKLLLTRIDILSEKLGPVLFQLPPRWSSNPQRLAQFLRVLSDDFDYAFEFRDPSWFNSETFALLEEHGTALCIYELNGFLSPQRRTCEFVYVRLHGPDGPYQGRYDQRALRDWASKLATWAREGHAVYCYFDNDQYGYAPRNALELSSISKRTRHTRARDAHRRG